jgi:hypothetical protein
MAYQTPEERITELEAEAERLRVDAARWAYVRDVLASPKMSGQALWRFRTLHQFVGATAAEAIDKAIVARSRELLSAEAAKEE